MSLFMDILNFNGEYRKEQTLERRWDQKMMQDSNLCSLEKQLLCVKHVHDLFCHDSKNMSF